MDNGELRRLKKPKLVWLRTVLRLKEASLVDYAEEQLQAGNGEEPAYCTVAPVASVKSILLSCFDGALLHLFRIISFSRIKSKRGLMLVSSGGLGDTILYSTIASEFAQLVPKGEPIWVIIRRESASAQFLFGQDFTIVSVDYRKYIRNFIYRSRVAWKIFSLNPALAIASDHLRHPFADDSFVRVSDAERKCALQPKWWEKHAGALAANKRVYDFLAPMSGRPMHRYLRWYHLLCTLRGENIPIPRIAGAFAALKPELQGRGYVVLHPFASTPMRQPAVDVFISVVDHIPADFEIVLSCGPGDLDRNADFSRLADNRRIRVDHRSLKDKASLLEGASLVITVDTSILHLAAVLGVRTLCIASAAHVIDSVPYAPEMQVRNVDFIVADMECAGCLGDCRYSTANNDRYPCVNMIESRAIVDAALRLLDFPEHRA